MGRGLAVLLLSLFTLSVVAGIDFKYVPQFYTAGTVADADVLVPRDLLVEDMVATSIRREQLRNAQPLIYDLSYAAYEDFNDQVLTLLSEINGNSITEEYVTIKHLEELLTPEVTGDIVAQLTRPSVQKYLVDSLLPRVRTLMYGGLAGSVRDARVGEAGVIIRIEETGNEILRPDITILPDVQSSLVSLASSLRNDETLDRPATRALTIVLSALLPASLSFNKEATTERAAAVVAHVEPIFYSLHKGEIVVRKGDIVSEAQQVKLQAIYNATGAWLHWPFTAGLFILSIIISMGLFIAPSGRTGTPLRCKDYFLMALLLTGSTLLAKILHVFLHETGELPISLALVFPVAGVVGLVTMVFAARRYCTMGLLLALFTTVMLQGDIYLFFYYFLSGMLTTLLVTRAQNRQDVVASLVPLTIGQLLFWFAAALISQTDISLYPIQIACVIGNSLLSLLILFAFGPLLEILFGYTTRFRLMELMSLEQPLMQQMMMTMPGTYHHSLVVANMVEAAAKAIGANSLLCKVGALYHDVGKLMHPEYFIENQFGGRNKHDKLAPSMSALILTAHVKKGTELAEKNKLGEEICDIIQQHHGTRVIRFFYQKAINLGENPRESDFCYAGPRPQTREAAILMLADSVEASCRTLTDPTPARLKNHINTIIKGIFAEGQLDESELTFKDLSKISDHFLRILTGIFHQRIAYPPPGTREAAREAAKDTAKDSSKAGGKDTAKPISKDAIKDISSENTKISVKENAKSLLKKDTSKMPNRSK